MPETIRITQRKGTAAQWAAAAPVLRSGEFGLETDTGIVRMGDGATVFPDLPPVNGDGGRLIYDVASGTLQLAAPAQIGNRRISAFNTPFDWGAKFDATHDPENFDSGAALQSWLNSNDSLWFPDANFGVHDGRVLIMPDNPVIKGFGGAPLMPFNQGNDFKELLMPGSFKELPGGNIIFMGTPTTNALYDTGRLADPDPDAFAELLDGFGDPYNADHVDGHPIKAHANPLPMMINATPNGGDISGFGIVQYQHHRDGANRIARGTDNQQAGYTCGYLNRGTNARIDINIYGFFKDFGLMQNNKPGDGNPDPDYLKWEGNVTSGIGILGSRGTAVEGGLTGAMLGGRIFGYDRPDRFSSLPWHPAVCIDGETGGTNKGIRAHCIRSSVRTFSDFPVLLGRCDDVIFLGNPSETPGLGDDTSEIPNRIAPAGLSSSGQLKVTHHTGNVRFVGIGSGAGMQAQSVPTRLKGKVINVGGAGSDDFFVGVGGQNGVGGRAPALVRISGDQNSNDPVIQLSDDITSLNNRWSLRPDASDLWKFLLKYGGITQLALTVDGILSPSRHFAGGLIDGAAGTVPVLDVAAGVLTVPETGNVFRVRGEGAATTDDIATITATGYRTIIFRNLTTGDQMTFKHGTGNIRCAGGVDIVLTDTDRRLVRCTWTGVNWLAERIYGDGQNPTATPPLLTIAAGVITPSAGFGDVFRVQAETGTVDDLNTITAVGYRTLLFRNVSSGDQITFKHNSGNIRCVGGADLILTNTTYRLMRCTWNGVNWIAELLQGA
ncbi:hypothetical protein [Salipiger sp.]|uniref:hyaluronate lyase N-terminal domain-containing protein n=1 Tax=Salipiger sp. TaxID=2078585 RepID=UPI003A9758DB